MAGSNEQTQELERLHSYEVAVQLGRIPGGEVVDVGLIYGPQPGLVLLAGTTLCRWGRVHQRGKRPDLRSRKEGSLQLWTYRRNEARVIGLPVAVRTVVLIVVFVALVAVPIAAPSTACFRRVLTTLLGQGYHPALLPRSRVLVDAVLE